MHFQVSRNGQTYGPYTLEDLERYVTSGNVLPTDLAKSEEMAEWLPVSQILGASAGTPSAFSSATPPTSQTFPSQTFPSQTFPSQTFSSQADQTPAANSTPSAFPTTQPSPYAAPAYPTPYAAPAQYPPSAGALAASRFPDPPNLHWGLVLLLAFVTNGLFLIIWEFVQVAWLKKVQPDTTAMSKYITAYALVIGGVIVALVGAGITAATSQGGNTPVAGILVALLGGLGYLAGFIFIIVARFSERASLEQHFNGPEPIGLRLSGAMTFFFGGFYFQYHLNRINELKTAARMGVPAAY